MVALLDIMWKTSFFLWIGYIFKYVMHPPERQEGTKTILRHNYVFCSLPSNNSWPRKNVSLRRTRVEWKQEIKQKSNLMKINQMSKWVSRHPLSIPNIQSSKKKSQHYKHATWNHFNHFDRHMQSVRSFIQLHYCNWYSDTCKKIQLDDWRSGTQM